MTAPLQPPSWANDQTPCWQQERTVHVIGGVLTALGVVLAVSTLTTAIIWRGYHIKWILGGGLPTTAMTAALGCALLCKKEFWHDPRYKMRKREELLTTLKKEGYAAMRTEYAQTKCHELIKAEEMREIEYAKIPEGGHLEWMKSADVAEMIEDEVIDPQHLTPFYLAELENISFSQLIKEHTWQIFQDGRLKADDVIAEGSEETIHMTVFDSAQLEIAPLSFLALCEQFEIQELLTYALTHKRQLSEKISKEELSFSDLYEKKLIWWVIDEGLDSACRLQPTFARYIHTLSFTVFYETLWPKARERSFLLPPEARELKKKYDEAKAAYRKSSAQADQRHTTRVAQARGTRDRQLSFSSAVQMGGNTAYLVHTSHRAASSGAAGLMLAGNALVSAQRARILSTYREEVAKSYATRNQEYTEAKRTFGTVKSQLNTEWANQRPPYWTIQNIRLGEGFGESRRRANR